MVRNGYDPLDVYTRTRGRTHRRRGAVNGSLEVDSLEYVPRLVVPWPTDSSTLSLGLVRLDRSLPLEIQPPLLPSSASCPSHSIPISLPRSFSRPSSPWSPTPDVDGAGTDSKPRRKQREGFRLPNWLDNESAARGAQDALKMLVDRRSAVILMSILLGNEFSLASEFKISRRFSVYSYPKRSDVCVDSFRYQHHGGWYTVIIETIIVMFHTCWKPYTNYEIIIAIDTTFESIGENFILYFPLTSFLWSSNYDAK